MKNNTHPKTESAHHLLRELETLKQVLDGQAGAQVTHARAIPVLEPLDDIPVLDEFFDDVPVLKAVVNQAVAKAQSITATPVEPVKAVVTELPKRSENPFLPQSVLDRLSHERSAAQQSAEEAHRTMLRITEQKHQSARSALAGLGKELSREQKDAVIDQMVNEMLPQIADRLREKLRLMLNR